MSLSKKNEFQKDVKEALRLHKELAASNIKIGSLDLKKHDLEERVAEASKLFVEDFDKEVRAKVKLLMELEKHKALPEENEKHFEMLEELFDYVNLYQGDTSKRFEIVVRLEKSLGVILDELTSLKRESNDLQKRARGALSRVVNVQM